MLNILWGKSKDEPTSKVNKVPNYKNAPFLDELKAVLEDKRTKSA